MWALWAGLAVLLCASGSSGLEATPIQIELEGGQERCISETLPRDREYTFKFKAVEGSGLSVDGLSVTIPDSRNRRRETIPLTIDAHERSTPKGEGGRYTMCFKSTQGQDKKGRVELEETTVKPDQEPERVANAEPLRPVVDLLKRAKEYAEDLKKDFKESSEHEADRQKDDKLLRSRINRLAMFTIVVLISVSGWQLALLNKFFRSKKLI